MPTIQEMWGSAEREAISEVFVKRLENAPLSLATLLAYESINGSFATTNYYDVPKEGHIINEIGVHTDSEKITTYKTLIRTYGIEYGPILFNNFALADTGHRLNVEMIGTDMANGAIRTQDREILKSFERPIEMATGEYIPFPVQARIPFDTTSASNTPYVINPVDPVAPTWAELNANSRTLGLTPQKIHLATTIMQANGIPLESPKICICSPHQKLNFINHPDVKDTRFNLMPELATTIGELQPYAELTGFIQAGILPKGLPGGPNAPYYESAVPANYVPAGMPAGSLYVEKVYIIAPEHIKAVVTEGCDWQMSEDRDLLKHIDLILSFSGKFGYGRTQLASVIAIECFTAHSLEFPFIINPIAAAR